LLLNPKFLLIGKQTMIPNYVKKGKFSLKIPIKIINRACFGYYKIKLSVKFTNKKYKLKKGETCMN